MTEECQDTFSISSRYRSRRETDWLYRVDNFISRKWRACFNVAIPFAVASLLFVYFLLPGEPETKPDAQTFGLLTSFSSDASGLESKTSKSLFFSSSFIASSAPGITPCNGTGCPSLDLRGQCFTVPVLKETPLTPLNLSTPKSQNLTSPTDSKGGQSRCRTLESNTTFQARVNAPTCIELLAVDDQQKLYDECPRQRASFLVTLTSDSATTPSMPVKLTAEVTYSPVSSTHLACFTPLLPGQYLLEAQLDFINAWDIIHRYDSKDGTGYRKRETVRTISVQIDDINEGQEGSTNPGSEASGFNFSDPSRGGLPPCTFDLLKGSRTEGSWVGEVWAPNVCSANEITQEDAYQLLDGKRIVFIGNSEMRYAFNVLRDFLNFNTNEEFFAARLATPRFNDPLEIPIQGGISHAPFPFNPLTGKAYTTTVDHLNSSMTYYGTFFDGFGFYSKRASSMDKTKTYSFNITFLTAMGPLHPVKREWMRHAFLTNGPTVPDPQGPYDLAFVTTGLWDLCEFAEANDMAQVYQKAYLPGVRSLVKSTDSMVFFGMWAAYVAQKPPNLWHCSNNIREALFEDAQLRVLEEEGYKNFISTRPMTLSRPDLCLDGIHYSWPVTLAMMNLAVGALKQQP